MAGWAYWVSFEHLAYGPSSYFRLHDTADAHGAFFVGQAAYARRDRPGNWAPSAGAGVDARANAKNSMPVVDAAFRAAPRWWLPGLYLCVQTFIAAFGALVFLRRHGVSIAPAVVAALSFSLAFDGMGAHSGFYLGLGLIISGLPLLFMGLVWTGMQTRAVAAAVAAVAGVFLGLSASAILIIPSLLLAGLWIRFVEPGRTRRHALVLAVCAASVLLMAVPSIAAMAMHAPESHRTLWPLLPVGVVDQAQLWTEQQSATMVLLRVHAPFLIAAAVGWLVSGFRNRSLNLLFGLALAILLHTSLSLPARSLAQWVYEPLATFALDRLSIAFLPFLAVAAGAVGLQQCFTFVAARENRFGRRLGTAAVGMACVAIAAIVVDRSVLVNADRETSRRDGENYGAFFQRPELIALADHVSGQPPLRVATFADANWGAGQHPAFAWAYGLDTADGYLNLYPRRYHAFWAQLIKPTLDFDDGLREYFEHWGNRFYLFNALLDSNDPQPAREAFNLNLLSLANVRYVISAVALQDPLLTEWRGRDRPVPAPQVPGEAAPSVRPLLVYENRAWLPRFFVTTRSRTFRRGDELLAAMAAASPEQLRDTVFLEVADAAGAPGTAPDVVGAAPPAPASTVHVRRYSADLIELEVDAGADGMLVATNSYNRFWRGFVNGAAVPVVPADYAFQGLPIRAGKSQVRLVYDPPYAFAAWQQGAAVVGVVLLALWRAPGRWVFRVWHSHRSRPTRLQWMTAAGVAGVLGVAVSAATSARTRPPVSPWIDREWPYRQPLVVSNPKGMSAPLEVPLLVQRDARDTAFWDHVPASPAGLRFTDWNGQVLPYEIEEFDPIERRLAAWVLVSGLSNLERTLFLYYGNPTAADAQAPGKVWDAAGYSAVWHMNDPPGSTSIRDSTTHGHHGVLADTMVGRSKTAGRIAGAVRFDGAKDDVTIPPSEDWRFGSADWMLEFWIRPAELGNRNFGIFQFGQSPMLFHLRHANILKLERLEPPADWSFHAANLVFNAWNHVALVQAGGRLKVVMNGALKQRGAGPEAFEDLPAPLTLGAGFQGNLEGELDEVRIFTGSAPAGWSRSVYLAQTGEMVVAGAEERHPEREQ
jgi:hypothetical protein